MNRKESAITFLSMVAERKIQQAYEKFIAPNFVHHNQYFKGDRQSLTAAMESAAEQNPNKSLEVIKVVEDGDTVVTLSHVKQNPDHLGGAVVHIFRFENDQVVELWDVGQEIVKDSPNENGPF
jgi:predicted SnoaL-like aldol condensation-catalyzing enzyme